jgi:hypothetical protein
MACSDQQQIRQHAYANGVLDPSLLPADLVLTQAWIALDLSLDQLHGPPF